MSTDFHKLEASFIAMVEQVIAEEAAADQAAFEDAEQIRAIEEEELEATYRRYGTVDPEEVSG